MSTVTPLVLDDDLDFEKYLADHETERHAEKVRPVSDFTDLAFERLTNGVAVTGEPLPWNKTADKFRFRSGELTIWAGVNGNGKSLVMGQVALWLDSPVVIASMEMKPEATVARLLRQAAGREDPTRQYVDAIVRELSGKLYIYDHVGTVQQNSVLGLCHYAAKEKGVKHVFIDSLVKCGLGVDDYNAQKNFVNRLAEAAKEHDIHIHLVVHIRKGNAETDIPDKFDIKGAGEITDLADNVLIIARNQSKEKAKRNNDKAYDMDKPDGFIRVAKQRHGEWEGLWGFWWDEKSQQWSSRNNAGALPWPHPGWKWKC